MSRIKVFSDLSRVRELTKKVPTDDGNGVSYVNDGKEEFFFEVSLDMDSVNRMAYIAARNKTGKAKRGGLEVKIVGRKRI